MASTPDDVQDVDDAAQPSRTRPPADDGARPGDASPPADDGVRGAEDAQDTADHRGTDDAQDVRDDSAEMPRRIPSEEELDRIAVDVRIRRRPRYRVFVVLGMFVAGAAAFIWASLVPADAHENWRSTVWVTTLGAMGLGALLGAGVAVFADWLSRRR